VDARVLSRLQREVEASNAHLLELKQKEQRQARIMHEAEAQARIARHDEHLPLPAINGVDGGGLNWFNSPAKPWWQHNLNPFLSDRKAAGDPIDDTRSGTPYLAPVVPGENGIPASTVRLLPGDPAAAREEEEASAMEDRSAERSVLSGRSPPGSDADARFDSRPVRRVEGEEEGRDVREGNVVRAGSAAKSYVSAAKSLLSWLQGAVSQSVRGASRHGDEREEGAARPRDRTRDWGPGEKSGERRGERPEEQKSDGRPQRSGEWRRRDARRERRLGEDEDLEATRKVPEAPREHDRRRNAGDDRLGSALAAALTGRASGHGGTERGSGRASRSGDGESQVWKDMRRLLVDTLRVKSDKQRAEKDKTVLARDSKMRRQESLGRLTFGHSVFHPQDIWRLPPWAAGNGSFGRLRHCNALALLSAAKFI